MSCQIFYHEYALDSLPTIQPVRRIPQPGNIRRRKTKNTLFYGEIRVRRPRAQCYPQFVIWTLGTLSQDERRRNACTRPCPLLVQSVANDPKQALDNFPAKGSLQTLPQGVAVFILILNLIVVDNS